MVKTFEFPIGLVVCMSLEYYWIVEFSEVAFIVEVIETCDYSLSDSADLVDMEFETNIICSFYHRLTNSDTKPL